MQNFLPEQLRDPLLYPCLLFLLTVPNTIRTIRNAGVSGRNQPMKPAETIKKMIVFVLLLYSISTLFNSDSANEEVQEEGQIDSSSVPH